MQRQPNDKGWTKQQWYKCQNEDCLKNTFMLEYHYQACETETKEKIIDMAINNAGIHDTARVLKIDKGTVISTLKKNLIRKIRQQEASNTVIPAWMLESSHRDVIGLPSSVWILASMPV